MSTELELLEWYSRACWAPVGVEADEATGVDPATDRSVQPEPCPGCGVVLTKDHVVVAEHILSTHPLPAEVAQAIRETEQNLVA
jgi:hypothetical protein